MYPGLGAFALRSFKKGQFLGPYKCKIQKSEKAIRIVRPGQSVMIDGSGDGASRVLCRTAVPNVGAVRPPPESEEDERDRRVARFFPRSCEDGGGHQ